MRRTLMSLGGFLAVCVQGGTHDCTSQTPQMTPNEVGARSPPPPFEDRVVRTDARLFDLDNSGCHTEEEVLGKDL